AEDGIRDRNVTGVQTCALPILANRNRPPPARQLTRSSPISNRLRRALLTPSKARRSVRRRRRAPASARRSAARRRPAAASRRWRSEERRVGKARTSRWAADEAE